MLPSCKGIFDGSANADRFVGIELLFSCTRNHTNATESLRIFSERCVKGKNDVALICSKPKTFNRNASWSKWSRYITDQDKSWNFFVGASCLKTRGKRTLKIELGLGWLRAMPKKFLYKIPKSRIFLIKSRYPTDRDEKFFSTHSKIAKISGEFDIVSTKLMEERCYFM